MDASDDILQILTEIRNLQKEHLREYKQFTARALDAQELALKRQAVHLTLYKRVLLAGGIVIVGLIVFLILFLNR